MAPSARARDLAARYGVPAAEVDDAPDDIAVLGLVLDHHVRPGPHDLTIDEVSAAAGVDPETTRRLWRALGFADPVDGDPVGSAEDVLVLQVAHEQVVSHIGLDRMVRQTRVISAAVTRIAELWSDEVREALDGGMDPIECGELYLSTLDLGRLEFLIGYVHRHQVQTAMRREFAARRAGEPGGAARVVGFADLVEFTLRTEGLTAGALAALVEAFEAFTHDTVAVAGGRVVKTIGDEVMFVTDDVEAAVTIARGMAGGAPGLPPLRVGLDRGAVVAFEGDLYGSVVNRAARVVTQAAPAGVAVTAAVRDAHPSGPSWPSIGVRSLKGLPDAELFAVPVPLPASGDR